MLNNTNAGWPQKPLSEVVDLNPRLDKSAYRDDLEVSFVPMAAVEAGSGRMEVSQARRFSTVKMEYTPFREGDVLFAKITPCMENGKMAVVPKLPNGLGFGSTEFHVLRPHQGIDPRYVYYFVSSQGFRREAAHRMTGAVGQKRVPKSFLEEASIPVPLFDDQQRIVAEIEKQFSRLDEAIANLKRVKANLKRYKAAVLKAAVEGKLTEDWRKQHPNVEPASKLLERILAERRAKWTGRGKYKEPAAPPTSELPSLPIGWTWATVGQVAAPEPNSITDGPFGSNLKTEHYKETGPRVIRLQNIGNGVFVNEKAHISEEHFARLQKHRIFADDLVIAALGEDPPRSCLIPKSVGHAIVKADCVRFKPHRGAVGRYLNVVLNSEPTRQRAKNIVHGVGRPRLNLGEIKTIVVPVPPTGEQQAIVAEVERRLSVIEELESTVEANLTRADRLRQSVLGQAFSGKLLLNEVRG